MDPAQLIDWVSSQPPTAEWIYAVLDYVVNAPDWALIDVGRSGGVTFWATFGYIPTRQQLRVDFCLVDAPAAAEPDPVAFAYLH